MALAIYDGARLTASPKRTAAGAKAHANGTPRQLSDRSRFQHRGRKARSTSRGWEHLKNHKFRRLPLPLTACVGVGVVVCVGERGRCGSSVAAAAGVLTAGSAGGRDPGVQFFETVLMLVRAAESGAGTSSWGPILRNNHWTSTVLD